MFGRKNKSINTKPIALSGFLSRQVAKEWEKVPSDSDHWMKFMAVQRPHDGDADVVDIRIYDQWVAEQGKIKVTDYASLDVHPELILFEGLYNEKAKKVDLKYKKAA